MVPVGELDEGAAAAQNWSVVAAEHVYRYGVPSTALTQIPLHR
jgi:hypothetical protein